MKDKIITSKKIIVSPSVIKDQSQSLSNFLSERFYSATKNHNSAIIIGSSHAHQSQDIEHDTILDSSGMLTTSDNIGFINGGRVAVVDGLGGGIGDQTEDDIINKIAYSTCETFLEKKEFKLLLSLLDNQIKPKTGFFQTLFGENQNKLYKIFLKQIELKFLDKRVPSISSKKSL
ncbi:MAG: hypothetical protein HYX60_06670 [Legionella longbeachae]|nr:hypothetical protein [Legionella longbeachae]